MSILNRLFKKKEDHWQKQAATLISVAGVNATSMYLPLLDEFPFLREVDDEHWNFILTVAGVFMAATRLNNLRHGDRKELSLMELVTESLDTWKPDGLRGFDDCKDLFEKEFDRLTLERQDSRFISSDAVGMWIVLNVLGRAPETKNECMLVRATGGMITHAFYDWWEK